MSTGAHIEWAEANQRWLVQALRALAERLQRHRSAAGGDGLPVARSDSEAALRALSRDMSAPPALEALGDTFGLTSFERNILLLCAGVELDGTIARSCAALLGTEPTPTFSLALDLFPDAHWSALAPDRPLRHWRLVEVRDGGSLTTNPLYIDERVLHYLAGVSCLDSRLEPLLEPIAAGEEPAPSHAATVERIVAAWSETSGKTVAPVVALHGPDVEAKRAIASRACAALGRAVYGLDAGLVPGAPAEQDVLGCVWTREAALTGAAMVLDCHGVEPDDAGQRRAAARFAERVNGMLIVAAREPRLALRRPCLAVDVPALTAVEQHEMWRYALAHGGLKVNGACARLAAQFNLGTGEIRAAAREALEADPNPADGDRLARDLWAACRARALPHLPELVQRIEPRATWDDLVLPPSRIRTLRQIAAQVRQRYTVYERWGFAAKCVRGLGISALFSGSSGTGKTMAAEVLAAELDLDLYRIDLAAVVSKYIGETEKNLRRIFDAAEAGSAILLFDEADALFGKRSEVRDSHDRYANVEISYLLQRMEDYRGLAVLTTNTKTALDKAFQRRIRFIVEFPYPDAKHRAEIWRQSFPEATPREGLDLGKLARLNVAGGHIRNIAMNAAFYAADESRAVQMRHILDAARSEYAKMEKPLTDAEVGDWVR